MLDRVRVLRRTIDKISTLQANEVEDSQIDKMLNSARIDLAYALNLIHIENNQKRRKPLKDKIIAQYKSGKKLRLIAKDLGVAIKTIRLNAKKAGLGRYRKRVLQTAVENTECQLQSV